MRENQMRSAHDVECQPKCGVGCVRIGYHCVVTERIKIIKMNRMSNKKKKIKSRYDYISRKMYLKQCVSMHATAMANGKGHDPLINFGSMIQSFQPLRSVCVSVYIFSSIFCALLSLSSSLQFSIIVSVFICVYKQT